MAAEWMRGENERNTPSKSAISAVARYCPSPERFLDLGDDSVPIPDVKSNVCYILPRKQIENVLSESQIATRRQTSRIPKISFGSF